MTRNVAISLMFLLSPLAAVGGNVDDCMAVTRNEIFALSRQIENTAADLSDGYRLISREEAGLVWLHNRVPVHRRAPDGTWRVDYHHRWYFAYPEDLSAPVSPDIMKVPIDPDEARARIVALLVLRNLHEFRAPSQQAECRNKFTDR